MLLKAYINKVNLFLSILSCVSIQKVFGKNKLTTFMLPKNIFSEMYLIYTEERFVQTYLRLRIRPSHIYFLNMIFYFLRLKCAKHANMYRKKWGNTRDRLLSFRKYGSTFLSDNVLEDVLIITNDLYIHLFLIIGKNHA